VEAIAADIVRRRAVRAGTSLEQADEDLEEARSLRETLALALFGDAGRGGGGGPDLKGRHGAAAGGPVSGVNTGAPRDLDAATLAKLPARTQDLVVELARLG